MNNVEYCYYCGVKLRKHVAPTHPQKKTRDHRVPLCYGGSKTVENRVWACFKCNQAKGSRTEYEFRKRQSAK